MFEHMVIVQSSSPLQSLECSAVGVSRISLFEHMSTTLRPSGLSRVVSEQMSARRRRAGALRYCQLDDWVVPTSFYLVEKVTVRTYG